MADNTLLNSLTSGLSPVHFRPFQCLEQCLAGGLPSETGAGRFLPRHGLFALSDAPAAYRCTGGV